MIRRTFTAVLVAVVLTGNLLAAGVSAQTRTPPPGARSSLSPPETNPIQAAAFRRGYEAYYRGEYERAAAIWTQLADQGHVKSMNNLGTMYAQGKGVSRNYELAIYYYRRSATQNDARGAYNLGIAYEYGRGTPKDDAQAVYWYGKAADRGLVQAMNAVAWLLATSPDFRLRDGLQAVRWAQAALQRRVTSTNLATLAAAQAEIGEYAKAVATIDQAIRFMGQEIDGAGLVAVDRDLFGLLRDAGRVDDVFKLLERREYYINGQPTRD